MTNTWQGKRGWIGNPDAIHINYDAAMADIPGAVQRAKTKFGAGFDYKRLANVIASKRGRSDVTKIVLAPSRKTMDRIEVATPSIFDHPVENFEGEADFDR